MCTQEIYQEELGNMKIPSVQNATPRLLNATVMLFKITGLLQKGNAPIVGLKCLESGQITQARYAWEVLGCRDLLTGDQRAVQNEHPGIGLAQNQINNWEIL